MSEGNPHFGATFAERKAARLAAEAKPAKAEPDAKAVKADEVEDKSVGSASTKARKTSARKKA